VGGEGALSARRPGSPATRQRRATGRPVRWLAPVCRSLLAVTASSLACLVAFGIVPLAWGWHPYTVVSGSMEPLVRRGDIVLAQPYAGRPLRAGEIVVIRPTSGAAAIPVTHRVVAVLSDERYRTRGDANPDPDSRIIGRADVLATARMLVPLLGLPALLPDRVRALVAVLTAGLVVVGLVSYRRPPGGHGSTGHPGARRRRGVDIGLAVVLTAAPVAGSLPRTAGSWTRTTSAYQVSFATKPVFYKQAVISSGPVSYWRLDESSGAAADQMGVASLTVNSPATRAVAGALRGDANTALAVTPNGDATTTTPAPAALAISGPLSVAAWVKVTSTQATNTRVLIKWNGSTALNYMMAWSATPTDMRFVVDTGAGGPTRRFTAQAPYPYDGGWHFLTGTSDGTSVKLYIDGSLVATTPITGTPTTLYSATDTLTISAPASGMKGSIDEVAVWSRLLGATEISTFYSLGTT
jgi:signal peptidase